MTTEQPAIPLGEIVQHTGTTEQDLIPPGAEADFVTEAASTQVARLQVFLEDRFPEELIRTNRQAPEGPVDIAIRLLSGLPTSGTSTERCREQYCNKPKQHLDHHGWIHHT